MLIKQINPRKKEGANMHKNIINLYDEYHHGTMDRREFLKKLSILAGSTAAANALLPLLENNRADAAMHPKDDPRLAMDYITYPGAAGDMRAYSARPKGDAKLPGVIIIHQNTGLNPHIEDVARRIAAEGFFALAPDALSPLGGTPEDAKKASTLIGQLGEQANTNNYLAAVKYLKTHPMSTGKVGVIGFCWGGAAANQLAVHSPDLSAAVPYYGAQPADQDVPKIKASLLLHYGGLDANINKGIPAYEAALKKAAIDYQLFIYEGAKHAFNDDTRADRYQKEAAQLAWQRTLAFLKEKLKT
jgi:carboxymethylenebutenolidase